MLSKIQNKEERILEAEMEEYWKDVILASTGIDLHKIKDATVAYETARRNSGCCRRRKKREDEWNKQDLDLQSDTGSTDSHHSRSLDIIHTLMDVWERIAMRKGRREIYFLCFVSIPIQLVYWYFFLGLDAASLRHIFHILVGW